MTEQEGKQSSHLPAAKYFCAQPRSTAAGTTAVTAVDRGRDDGRHPRSTAAGTTTVTCIKRGRDDDCHLYQTQRSAGVAHGVSRRAAPMLGLVLCC